MKNKKPRIELIDLAKAVSIFLVILGHTWGNLDTAMLRRFLYAFHMPLFFFLSGLSLRPSAIHGRPAWKLFLRKNILALAVPYLVWAFVYAPFTMENIPRFLYGSWAMLDQSGTLTSLWYLTALFVARLLAQGVISLLDRSGFRNLEKPCGLCSVPLFLIGFLLPRLSIGYPWCADVAFVAAGFILLGTALRKPLLILAQQKVWVLLLFLAGSTALLLTGTVARGDSLELMRMCAAEYYNVFWFFMNSLSGTMAVLSVSMLLQRTAREGARPFSTAAIRYIGRHTLGIFLIHKNLLQMLFLPALRSLITGHDMLTALLGSCAALAASLPLCALIERYVPQLLGQEHRP